jgi:hypothetical protein
MEYRFIQTCFSFIYSGKSVLRTVVCKISQGGNHNANSLPSAFRMFYVVEDGMDRACSKHGRAEESAQCFGEKATRNETS